MASPSVPQLVAVLGRGVVPADTPLATASDLGLTRGDGCFDAMRVVVDGSGRRVDHAERHLARFLRSCELMDLPGEDVAAWRALIDEAVANWDVPGDAVCKIVLTRGPEYTPGARTAFCTITPFEGAGRPLDAVTLDRGYTSTHFVDHPAWLLGGVKSVSYGVHMAAIREAARRGATEALFASSDGFCLEGPTSALLSVSAGRYARTPVEGTGILDSVTLAVIAEGLWAEGTPVAEVLLTPEELVASDAAWLVSAVRGVCALRSLDGRPLKHDDRLTGHLAGLAGFGPEAPVSGLDA